MKKITLLLVIIFTFLFSTTSWGDWELVAMSKNGIKFYYDKDRYMNNGIEKRGGQERQLTIYE